MDKQELKNQKKFVLIFEELQKELEANAKNRSALGWQHRNELITHFYSNYGNHVKLNAKKDEITKEDEKGEVLRWLNKLFSQKRNSFGYFRNYEEIFYRIKDFKELAIYREKYEIVYELTIWENKLLNITNRNNNYNSFGI